MKQVLRGVAFTILVATSFFISCKKEVSCADCKENHPPIANAGADQKIILPKDSVLLDGSLSSDADGSITAYKWTKISGPLSSNIIKPDSCKTLVNALAMGVYKFELTVTDNGGLKAKDTVEIMVSSTVNHPPTANAGLDITIILPINSLVLDGSASSDPDNNITTYLWTKISGPTLFNIPNISGVRAQVTNLVKGTYLFELAVTDSGGLSSKDSMQIIVNDQSACDSTLHHFNDTVFQNITISPFVEEEVTNTYWGSATVMLQQVDSDNKYCLHVFLSEGSSWHEVPLYVLGPSYLYFTVNPGIIKIYFEKSAATFINPAGDLVSVKVIYPQ